VVESAMDHIVPAAERRDRALTMIAAEIGVIAVARAAAKSRPDLSNRVLAAARRVLTKLGDAPRCPRRVQRKRR